MDEVSYLNRFLGIRRRSEANYSDSSMLAIYYASRKIYEADNI